MTLNDLRSLGEKTLAFRESQDFRDMYFIYFFQQLGLFWSRKYKNKFEMSLQVESMIDVKSNYVAEHLFSGNDDSLDVERTLVSFISEFMAN